MLRRGIAVISFVIVVAALVAVVHKVVNAPAVPDPGVPLGLALDRAARISALRYDVAFTIPAGRAIPIRGHVVIAFALSDPSRDLALDFAQPATHLRGVTANRRTVDLEITNGHILLPKEALVAGENTVDVDFVAGDESLNRNDDYLYTLFVPARASLAMPCFDQPDLKARWTLVLEIPKGWTAVSNGRETGQSITADHTGLVFEQTLPLPTYLFAFAAGRFSIETAVRDGRTFRMFHRETDAAKVARNRDAIFDLHARALAWLQDYTGIPYPFGKFDFVLIPAFQFGGMEHAGAIYYNAGALMLDEASTENQRLSRANTISHETAHMWFGDLVTMKWFDDVWMKEVFANVMAAKIVNPSFPEVNHDLRFLMQNYPVAYDVDRTDGANPIRQPLANLDEAGSLYGAIIYQKAPIVMRQLELLMGPAAFRDSLRDYLARFKFSNASWTDLVGILAAHTTMDVTSWSRAWVDEPGRPTVRTSLALAGGRIERLAFDEVPPERGSLRSERLTMLVGLPGEVRSVDVTISSAHTEVPQVIGWPAPLWILPTGGGLGYGFFDVDPTTLEFLSTSLPTIADPLTRGTALVTLWELMLEGRVLPARVFDELLVSLPRETNALNLSQMLDDTRAVFWRFTPAAERAAAGAKLDAVLMAGLARASSTSEKASWFNALRSTATTPAAVDWLEQVWRRTVTIPGLPISEPDEADLALELGVRNVPHAEEILATERDRLVNPDRKARFTFVMTAVSPDPAIRQAFFESFKDVKQRGHEAWVLDAERYLNHPFRQQEAVARIRPALSLLWEIQRTGDIFFPKRWADATLGGHRSAQAAAEVRAFLKQLPPDYPVRLKWIIESAADPLFRAAR